MAYSKQSEVASFVTSVTEEDVSLSESDTTESYDSKTSSLMEDKSYNTDDKLTPCLNNISISKGARKKMKKASYGANVCEDECFSIKPEPSKHSFARPFAADRLPQNRNISQHSKKHQSKKKRESSCYEHEQRVRYNYGPSSRGRRDVQNNDRNAFMFDNPDYNLYTDFSNAFPRGGNSRFQMYNEEEEEDSEEVSSDTQERPYFPDMTSPLWYTARVFDKYWNHYNFAMEWYREHERFVQIQHQHFFNPMFNATFQPQGHPPKQRTRGPKDRKKKKRARNRRAAKARHKLRSEYDEEPVAVEDDEEEEETIEMEITEDMINFFSLSHKHRLERDKLKQNNGEQEVKRIDLEQAKLDHQGPSSASPAERPGARRTAEMKMLFGKGAAMIHGMETALQMTFDRFMDRYQPKLWPNMPLKMCFS